MTMSKHVGVWIIHCRDIYFYDINCAYVGYNKIIINNKIQNIYNQKYRSYVKDSSHELQKSAFVGIT
jgi:hypothetical protein